MGGNRARHAKIDLMHTRLAGALAIALFLPVTLWSQTVRFHTNLGDIDVVLLPDSAPLTVANFLNYANRGDFNNSIIHRSVPGFIFQGGGYQWKDGSPVAIPSDPPVQNEYNVSNTRGTLAMAKLGTDANSATNQWFFNLANNAANLDNQNGGFTVFGRIANSAGTTIMDRIASVPVPNPPIFNSPFDQMPLINYKGGALTDQNVVLVLSVTVLGPAPSISAGGVITASGYGAFPVAAPGSFIEIYGSNLAGGSGRGWAPGDFKNGVAPQLLDGVTVTIGGRQAYIIYVSPTLVSAQVPAGVATSGSVSVVVNYNGQASAPVMLAMKPFAGGLLATPNFKVGDKQYVVAVHASNGAYVSNGSIPDVPAAPAVPGETLLFYGIGFGPVNPSSVPIAGQIVQGRADITTSLQFNIGGSPAQVVFAGLAPSLVGLYQFNVTLPQDVADGDQPLQVVLGGEPIAQTLYVPVQAQ